MQVFRAMILLVQVFISHNGLGAANQGDIAVFIDAGDNQALITAIENANNDTGPGLIFVRPNTSGAASFTFDQPYMGTDNALPVITSNIEIFPIDSSLPRVTFNRSPGADPFRFVEVVDGGILGLGAFNIEGFSISGNGGAITATGTSSVSIRGSSFRNNNATAEGGAIHMDGDSRLFVAGTGRLSQRGPGEFFGNRAGTLGGAISITGNAAGNIRHGIFANNNAGVFGCDINLNSASNAMFGRTLIMENNTFTADCPNVLFENPFGKVLLRNNTFAGSGDGIDSTDSVVLFSNLFDLESTTNRAISQAVCNDFGTNAFQSEGHNMSNEASCGLIQATDFPNTDPKTLAPDQNNSIGLAATSPAIDAGSALMSTDASGPILPCGYKDSRGLGRPQDANDDGTFECDIGSYEVQGGDDLTIAQSGAYFDTGRSGEGVFVEMLSATQALLFMYTYDPNGQELMWLLGVGDVVGNSLVIDELAVAQGGVFGPDFNPNAITRPIVGSLSMVFPNCAANPKAGRMTFEALPDAGLEHLLVKATRITSLLTCGSNNQESPFTGRSGSFFDPNRSGEGVQVQILSNGMPLVVVYTFTPDGKQFWMISDGAQINGDTIIAPMLYAANGTRFGSQFNANDIDLQPWGTVTLKYMPGCNDMTYNYNSGISGFGNAEHNYTRITQLAGTTCDL